MNVYHLHIKPGDSPADIALQKLHFQHFTQHLSSQNKLRDKQLFYSLV